MRRAFVVYLRLLENHPWKVQSIQTGIMMSAGDVISQTVVEKKKFSEMDAVRVARFGAMGVIFMGPALWAWYQTLHRFVGPGVKGTKGRVILGLKKVFWDQVVLAPPFYAAFIVVHGAFHLENWGTIRHNMDTSLKDIIINNWKLWPAVQFVNFSFVPLKFQVLFEQSFCLIWNTYLAWKMNRIKHKEMLQDHKSASENSAAPK